MYKQLTYANYIPLIGGLSFAAQSLIEKEPEYNVSFDVFEKNEEEYQKIVKSPFYLLKDSEFEKHGHNQVKDTATEVNLVTSLCPCGGLSMLNTTEARGGNSTTNRFIYRFISFGIDVAKADAIVFENAPGLITLPDAENIRTWLNETAIKNDYSILYLLTDTSLFSTPQARKRTYCILVKNKQSGVFKLPKPEKVIPFEFKGNFLADAIKNPEGKKDEKSKIFFELKESPFYQFMISKFGSNFREVVKEAFKDTNKNTASIMNFIIRKNLMDEFIAFNTTCEKTSARTKRWKEKLANGKGFWDISPNIPLKFFPGIISKNGKQIVHPTEDRFLSLRELMRLMNLPEEMAVPKYYNTICQNTPVSTSKRAIKIALDFIEGTAETTDGKVGLYNDMKNSFSVSA